MLLLLMSKIFQNHDMFEKTSIRTGLLTDQISLKNFCKKKFLLILGGEISL